MEQKTVLLESQKTSLQEELNSYQIYMKDAITQYKRQVNSLTVQLKTIQSTANNAGASNTSSPPQRTTSSGSSSGGGSASVRDTEINDLKLPPIRQATPPFASSAAIKALL